MKRILFIFAILLILNGCRHSSKPIKDTACELGRTFYHTNWEYHRIYFDSAILKPVIAGNYIEFEKWKKRNELY